MCSAQVNGEPLGDPLVLWQKFARLAGQEIAVVVARGAADKTEEVEIRVTPESRFRRDAPGPGALVGIESIGVAFAVTNTVADVESGGPAQQAGLQAGDELRLSTFVPATPEAAALAEKWFGRSWNRPIEFDAKQENWAYLSDFIQIVPEGIDLKLDFVRGGQEMTATMRPVDSTEWFNPDRGLRTTVLERIHTAETWGEAFDEGLRRTRTDLIGRGPRVKKLVTGEVSPKLLGRTDHDFCGGRLGSLAKCFVLAAVSDDAQCQPGRVEFPAHPRARRGPHRVPVGGGGDGQARR